jgi:hypothetical protein
LLSSQETQLKPHERFSIPNYNFYRIGRHPGIKGGTAVAVRKGIPHNYVDLPLLISIEATGVYIAIGHNEILLLFTNLQVVPGYMQPSLSS